MVRICHPFGFDDHHGLVLDPAFFADLPQVPQENGFVFQYFLKAGVLGVVVEDGVEIPVSEIGVEVPAQVFFCHPLVDLGLLFRCGPVVRPPLAPLGVDPV